METINLIKKSLVICLASFILACGAETLAIIFIPAFAGPWPVEGVNGYDFNLQSDDEGKESGIITGEESNHPSGLYKFSNDLNGSFKGLSIEFTIERVSENGEETTSVKYTGKMIPVSDKDHNIIRIELNNSDEGELILVPE